MKNLLLFSLLFILTACSFLSAGMPSQPPVSAANEPLSTVTPLPATTTPVNAKGYITFVINVHDWVNTHDSADTLLHLIDIFEKYGVRGDFYFTAPVVEKYIAERPDVIERLKSSGMTISYHVRPPHPLYTNFDSRLQGLDDAALYKMLLEYETYALDLSTGELDRSRPGGYSYVAQVFGIKPVCAPAPNSNRRIKETAERVYAALGAQMTILYHEEGTAIDQPFVYSNGLLVRPSDFSITRVPDGENFWWNFMVSPHAAEYDPATMLQSQLAAWNAQRAPIVTSLIHENNFYRSGPESWTPIYFSGKDKSNPLTPPFNLNARDISKPRSPSEQQAIWDAYERMVAYAAANLQVVTSAELVKIAK